MGVLRVRLELVHEGDPKWAWRPDLAAGLKSALRAHNWRCVALEVLDGLGPAAAAERPATGQPEALPGKVADGA